MGGDRSAEPAEPNRGTRRRARCVGHEDWRGHRTSSHESGRDDFGYPFRHRAVFSIRSYDNLACHGIRAEFRFIAIRQRRYDKVPQVRGHFDYWEVSTPLSMQWFCGWQRGELYGLDHDPARTRAR